MSAIQIGKRIGKVTSAILAVVPYLAAPMVANAFRMGFICNCYKSSTEYFFIPDSFYFIGGFFMKKVSAMGAQSGPAFSD